MSNLIKSEWYRISHSNPSLRVILLVLFCCALISFVGGEMPGFYLESVSQTGAISMFICSMALAALIGTSYTQRVAFYEIMDGKSPNKIIFSKLAVYAALALAGYYLPVSALLLIFDSGAETVTFVALFFFVFMRAFIFTLSLPMIFKSTDGVAAVMVRVMAETMLVAFSQPTETMQKLPSVLEWLPAGQIFNMGFSISGELTAKVMIGFAAEAAVMYALTYMSYKKKWMIKTTIM